MSDSREFQAVIAEVQGPLQSRMPSDGCTPREAGLGGRTGALRGPRGRRPSPLCLLAGCGILSLCRVATRQVPGREAPWPEPARTRAPSACGFGGGMLLVLAGRLSSPRCSASPPRCSPSPPRRRRPGSATRPRRHSRTPWGFCFIRSRLIQARIPALNPTPKGDYSGTARQPLDCFVHPP